MSLQPRDPDLISWQTINMMLPPDDQPNLAEQGDIIEEPIYLDEIEGV